MAAIFVNVSGRNEHSRMSYIKLVHIVVIRYQTWPPQAIIVSDWLISKKILF
jgi:hypothetical protein